MEKFRSPVPRAAAARKHQANGCSRVGREKLAPGPLELRPPTMVINEGAAGTGLLHK